MEIKEPTRLRWAATEVVGQASVPYGYTLTTWSAGALCIARFGLPVPLDAFLFVTGAGVAYSGLALLVRRAGRTGDQARRPAAVLWENWVALPALGATYGLNRLIVWREVSFFLVPLVATSLYLVGVSLLLAQHRVGNG